MAEPQCYIRPGSPPSSYAVAAVLEGEPGGWWKVAKATALRAVFVAPGVAVAGLRGRKLVLGSLLGSVGITIALFALYGAQRGGAVADWARKQEGSA